MSTASSDAFAVRVAFLAIQGGWGADGYVCPLLWSHRPEKLGTRARTCLDLCVALALTWPTNWPADRTGISFARAVESFELESSRLHFGECQNHTIWRLIRTPTSVGSRKVAQRGSALACPVLARIPRPTPSRQPPPAATTRRMRAAIRPDSTNKASPRIHCPSDFACRSLSAGR
jgi:hypothetical protein